MMAMKKIMFSDKYGLTQSVLEGYKIMTRRAIVAPKSYKGKKVRGFYVFRNYPTGVMDVQMVDEEDQLIDGGKILPKYKVGETVAIAQSYRDIANKNVNFRNMVLDENGYPKKEFRAGWSNKMFTRPELLSHHIRIVGVKIEELQDISEVDCMNEGIRKSVIEYEDKLIVQYTYFGEKRTRWFDTAREAFAAMIDRISGRGTWESNPFVFVYEFELVD